MFRVRRSSTPLRSCCFRVALEQVTPSNPESIALLNGSDAGTGPQNHVDGVVRRIVNLGTHVELLVAVAGGLNLTVLVPSGRSSLVTAMASTATLGIDPQDVQVLSD